MSVGHGGIVDRALFTELALAVVDVCLFVWLVGASVTRGAAVGSGGFAELPWREPRYAALMLLKNLKYVLQGLGLPNPSKPCLWLLICQGRGVDKVKRQCGSVSAGKTRPPIARCLAEHHYNWLALVSHISHCYLPCTLSCSSPLTNPQSPIPAIIRPTMNTPDDNKR